jgi:hypothetical protein
MAFFGRESKFTFFLSDMNLKKTGDDAVVFLGLFVDLL